jgi:hypothetical protein
MQFRSFAVPLLALMTGSFLGDHGQLYAQAEENPNAMDVLRQVADAYGKLDSYEWTAQSTSSFDNGISKSHDGQLTTVFVAFRRPGQMHLEVRPISAGPFNGINVTNGNTVWRYIPYLRICCHPGLLPVPPYVTAALGSSLPYERIMEKLKSADFAGTSTLIVDGQSIRCFLVNAIYEPETKTFQQPAGTQWTQAAVTYWIDPNTNLVMQQYHHQILKLKVSGRINPPYHYYVTTSVVRFRMNPRLPDSLFLLRIPTDVHEMKRCPSGGGG